MKFVRIVSIYFFFFVLGLEAKQEKYKKGEISVFIRLLYLFHLHLLYLIVKYTNCSWKPEELRYLKHTLNV